MKITRFDELRRALKDAGYPENVYISEDDFELLLNWVQLPSVSTGRDVRGRYCTIDGVRVREKRASPYGADLDLSSENIFGGILAKYR